MTELGAALFPAAWFAPRLHLGLGNPNVAGALLAMALVSGLAFTLGGQSRGGRLAATAAALALAGGLGLALAMTGSRGGLVALLVGIAVLLVAGARTAGDRARLAAAALLATCVFLLSPAGRRWQPPAEDGSAASRVRVFARVPAMVAAAPTGWGPGRSGEAYRQWFQVGDTAIYRHVLSTHAVWLTERPWVAGWLYLFGWGVALVWVAPGRAPWTAGALACGVAFAVAGCFSHVGERAVAWAFPGAWLVAAGVARAREGRWPWPRAFAATALAAAGAMAALLLMGWPGPTEPRLRAGVVELPPTESGPPARRLAVAADGPMATWLGAALRAARPVGTTVGFAWADGAELRAEAVFLVGPVDVGQLRFSAFPRRVIWASPLGVLPWQFPDGLREARFTVLRGQFAGFSPEPWTAFFAAQGQGEVVTVRGQGDFLQDVWGQGRRALVETE